MVKQVLRDNRQKAKPEYFNCAQSGHFQRNSKAPWNRSRPVSLTRRYAVATAKAPGKHYVETISYKRIGEKPLDSEGYPKVKVPEIEPNNLIGKPPNSYTQ